MSSNKPIPGKLYETRHRMFLLKGTKEQTGKNSLMFFEHLYIKPGTVLMFVEEETKLVSPTSMLSRDPDGRPVVPYTFIYFLHEGAIYFDAYLTERFKNGISWFDNVKGPL